MYLLVKQYRNEDNERKISVLLSLYMNLNLSCNASVQKVVTGGLFHFDQFSYWFILLRWNKGVRLTVVGNGANNKETK